MSLEPGEDTGLGLLSKLETLLLGSYIRSVSGLRMSINPCRCRLLPVFLLIIFNNLISISFTLVFIYFWSEDPTKSWIRSSMSSLMKLMKVSSSPTPPPPNIPTYSKYSLDLFSMPFEGKILKFYYSSSAIKIVLLLLAAIYLLFFFLQVGFFDAEVSEQRSELGEWSLVEILLLCFSCLHFSLNLGAGAVETCILLRHLWFSVSILWDLLVDCSPLAYLATEYFFFNPPLLSLFITLSFCCLELTSGTY